MVDCYVNFFSMFIYVRAKEGLPLCVCEASFAYDVYVQNIKRKRERKGWKLERERERESEGEKENKEG